ncbi:MAG: hypothetical protein PHS44_05460 [Candidatus Dojkabacteria bacterium]|nr:hypothetical protein [Candidatus Dojkabacteria bacterium]
MSNFVEISESLAVECGDCTYLRSATEVNPITGTRRDTMACIFLLVLKESWRDSDFTLPDHCPYGPGEPEQ